jgi:hypothetical protein
MNKRVSNEVLASFPTVSFRKKRLTVAIHAQFDLESPGDVEQLRSRIDETMALLGDRGEAKIVYTLNDL